MLFFGIFSSAAIIGAIQLLLNALDINSAERESELAAAHQFFISHPNRVPPLMEARVMQFFNHQWDTGTAPYYHRILARLPALLGQELTLVLKRRLIEMVPMFANCLPHTTLALVRCLKSTTAIPHETIMREGAPGDCMYFLAAGKVEVSHTDARGERVVLVELLDGSFFGELALLGENVRSATVKAKGFCELERLSYEDFDALLKTHDELLAVVIDCAKVRIDRLRKSYKEGRLAGLLTSERVIRARQNLAGRDTPRLSARGTQRLSARGDGDFSSKLSGNDHYLHVPGKFWKHANTSSQGLTIFDAVYEEAIRSKHLG